MMSNPIEYEITQLRSAISNNFSISLENLYKHREVIFEDSSIDATVLLKLILTNYRYSVDERVSKIQAGLLKFSLDKGANINDSELYFGDEALYNHYELLLTHPTNPISQEIFLEKIVKLPRPYRLGVSGERVFEEDYIKHKAELLEIAYKNAQNSLSFDENIPFEAVVVKKLAERGVINDQTAFKLALKASGINYGENGSSYNLDEVAIQKQLIEDYLAKGMSIDNLSFNELNIENNNISILKVLINAGLDPRALLIHSPDNQDSIDVLNLALEKGVRIIALDFIMHLLVEGLSIEVAKLMIDNYGQHIDYKFSPEAMVSDFVTQGPKFKEYFDELSKDVDFQQVMKELLAEGGSILHILAKSDKQELIKFVLENYEYDINNLNNLGQTPLFFAKSPEVAQHLIDHSSNLEAKDNGGNIWVSNISLELIGYAVENDYLPKDYAERAALKHFSKGNYEHAAKLYKIGFELEVDLVSEMVDSIMNGLQNSLEKNKYQAILNLINKAGIIIPSKFEYLLNSYGDDHSEKEFEFLNGLLHKLAKHYINLSKGSLEDVFGLSEELDYAYKNFDFKPLKALHPDNLELSKINDAFGSYYQISGKALIILDNDFALEVLTINGLRPEPLEKELTVFRGMKVNLDQADKDSYFQYGHRSFSTGEYQKTLGFYVDQPWNKLGRHWEYGGTYSSVEAIWASNFACGLTSYLEAESVLMEIKLPKASPKICGSWKHEFELVPSSISGENIVAIYTIDKVKDKDGQYYQVYTVNKNPYIDSAITPKFKAYDKIKSDAESIKIYDSLGCKDLPTLGHINKSGLYHNYTDFMERYTPEHYVQDNAKLLQDYFYGRETYVDDFIYGISDECDLANECCY